MSELQGKVAFITGGARGIGQKIAKAFLLEGAVVGIMSRSKQESIATTLELDKISGSCFGYIGDVSDANSCLPPFLEFVKRNSKLDILVNCAAIQTPHGEFWMGSLEEFLQTFNINFGGTARMCKAAIPFMQNQGKGKIINFSGGGAATQRVKHCAYSASKAAIVKLTEVLGDELRGYCIDVNAIAPGKVFTEMLASDPYEDRKGATDGRRAVELVCFLASDASDGITGKLISALHDPWDKPWFKEWLDNNPERLTLRRFR